MFRLRRDAVVAALEQAARRLLAARPEVLEVRLFGSLATGRAGPSSDADILIILAGSTMPFLDRIGEYSRFVTGVGIGCDIFPYTTAELARLRGEGRDFAMSAWEQSRVLATRTPPVAGAPTSVPV